MKLSMCENDVVGRHADKHNVIVVFAVFFFKIK